MRRPILHLHIPKTGGQMFGASIASMLPSERVYYLEGDLSADRDELKTTDLAATRSFVSCHVNGPLLARVDLFDVVTLVRNPVDQIISSYLHVIREPAHLLHALLKAVPFQRALDMVPDWFFNVQARYVTGAFHEWRAVDLLKAPERLLLELLCSATGRIRWMGASETLDSFLTSFCIDATLPARLDLARVNETPHRERDLAPAIREWLQKDPGRYAIDLVLYQEAVRRGEELRVRTIDKVLSLTPIGSDVLQNSGIVVQEPGRLLRLGRGWMPARSVGGWGIEHRAGPGLLYSLAFRRRPDDLQLVCDVAFTAGVTLDEIRVLNLAKCTVLAHHGTKVGDIQRLTIDMSALDLEGELAIWVPRIFPLSMFSGGFGHDDERVSMSVGHWRFISREQMDNAPAEVVGSDAVEVPVAPPISASPEISDKPADPDATEASASGEPKP